MTADPLGVGFVGAGPVTQAIHLPTLARLTELFTVTHVTDITDEIATSVAARVGARSSTSIDELLGDPRVDVVAVRSPHQFHAAQVIDACRAGKKAVLCEKPFATSADEAAEIAAVSAETEVPIIVGAMHAFDPGWLDAVAHGTICRRRATLSGPRSFCLPTRGSRTSQPRSSPGRTRRRPLDDVEDQPGAPYILRPRRLDGSGDPRPPPRFGRCSPGSTISRAQRTPSSRSTTTSPHRPRQAGRVTRREKATSRPKWVLEPLQRRHPWASSAAAPFVRQALELGITFWDTALAARPGQRDTSRN